MAQQLSSTFVSEMANQRKSFLSTLGLVGIGVIAVGAAGVIYISYQVKQHFRAQEAVLKKLVTQIQELKIEIEELKSALQASSSIVTKSLTSSKRSRSILDDDEFLTADEDDEDDASSENKTFADGAQTLFMAKIDALLDGSVDEQQRAYRILKEHEHDELFQNSCEFWWRLAKSTHFDATIAGADGDKLKFQDLITQGYTYAGRAVELNDNSANAHKWFAILSGSRSDFLGTNDRIKSGHAFKEHVDRAIFLDPNDSTCYYLLGRFCLEVSSLSWLERQVASTLFSAPPSSTPEEAMTYFKKCEAIKPFMDNRFYMAKCYYAQQNKIKALRWLNLAASMPAISATDKACLQNVIEFRRQLQQ